MRRPLDILTDDEVKRIHYAALEILSRTGVVFHHRRALELLGDAHCTVDMGRELVRFPAYLVEESLRKCPRRVLLKGTSPEYDVTVGDPYVHFASCIAMDTLDLDTMDRRPPTLEDHINMVRVLDQLDTVHLNSGPYSHMQGVPDKLIYPSRFAASVKYSSKPSITAGMAGTELSTIEIARVVGQNPAAHVQCSPPLTVSFDKVECLFNFVEAGHPILPGSGLAMGMTCPVTMAGALAQQLAEILSVIVLAQLVNPGTGVIAKSRIEPADMTTGTVAEGGVEKAIADAAWNQIWRWYQVPRFHVVVSTDSKVPDYQCGTEKALQFLFSALTGSNIIAGIGGVYDELTASPLVAIMDDELARQVGKMVSGIDVNEDTLAVDLIDKVGPIPGQFLSTSHTRKFWRQELLVPRLADRIGYAEWTQRGRKTVLDYARDRYWEILSTPGSTPLNAAQQQEVESVLERARKEHGGTD